MLDQFSQNLHLTAEGIWQPDSDVSTQTISYPDDGHLSRVNMESQSFWFNHRNNFIKIAIQHFPPNGAVIDIGGGNGYVTLGLQEAGVQTVLVEPGPTGASNAKNRGIKHVACCSFQQACFQSGVLPAAGLFDVIEHIENDQDFLQDLYDKLKDNGLLYITVPAYNFLWSAKDIHEGHYRRHTLNSISTILKASGFKIEYSTYFFSFLILPILLLKAMPYKLGLKKTHNTNKGQQEHAKNGFIAKRILDLLCGLELKAIKNKKRISFGSSILIVARKVKN